MNTFLGAVVFCVKISADSDDLFNIELDTADSLF
jgi:hypothetical protein